MTKLQISDFPATSENDFEILELFADSSIAAAEVDLHPALYSSCGIETVLQDSSDQSLDLMG